MVLTWSCPTPGGPACDWALHHLVEIVDAAYPADLPALAVKRVRMMALAHHLQDTMGDLCRNEWQSQGGADCAQAVLIPQRLSRLAIFYVRAFDVTGTSAYGGYYLHDFINHLGHSYQCVNGGSQDWQNSPTLFLNIITRTLGSHVSGTPSSVAGLACGEL